jgi:hypothetical protein
VQERTLLMSCFVQQMSKVISLFHDFGQQKSELGHHRGKYSSIKILWLVRSLEETVNWARICCPIDAQVPGKG